MAVEEPAYVTVTHEGHFEVRDYPQLVVAEVTVSGDQKEAASKGFRLLANYIFGGNTTQGKIAMSAPVAQQKAGSRIAMTAPVTQTRQSDDWIVRFTMPASYSLETLPKPDDARVHLRVMPSARYAVVRFSGIARPPGVAAKTNELSRLIESHHLRRIGPVALAQYNAPWTLGFMRRNEVMAAVEK